MYAYVYTLAGRPWQKYLRRKKMLKSSCPGRSSSSISYSLVSPKKATAQFQVPFSFVLREWLSLPFFIILHPFIEQKRSPSFLFFLHNYSKRKVHNRREKWCIQCTVALLSFMLPRSSTIFSHVHKWERYWEKTSLRRISWIWVPFHFFDQTRVRHIFQLHISSCVIFVAYLRYHWYTLLSYTWVSARRPHPSMIHLTFTSK